MNDLIDLPAVSYSHPKSEFPRFRQYAKDPVPTWAVNVTPDQTDRQRYQATQELVTGVEYL